MSQSKTLSSCKIGETVRLNEIKDRQLSVQLYTMGCIPGEMIKIERIAPFGDPILIQVDESFISIRKSDAKLIEIENI